MPSEMDGKSGAFPPCLLGRGQESEAIMYAALHFHHVGDDVNGAGMPGLECQGAAGDLFSETVLAILLRAKRTSRAGSDLRVPLIWISQRKKKKNPARGLGFIKRIAANGLTLKYCLALNPVAKLAKVQFWPC